MCLLWNLRKQLFFFSEKRKEKRRKQQFRGYLSIYYINVLLNRRVTLAYVLSGRQWMLLSFTLALTSQVCSTTVVRIFTTFCKADEDINRAVMHSCGLYIGLPWSWENRFFAHLIFFGDGFVAYLYHQMKQEHMYTWSGFLYQYSATPWE